MKPPFRSGLGYDIHRMVPGRKLILGGVEIPHAQGLDGHSDADTLSHAIADAILGAVAAPDIGQLFPNTDPELKGLDSQLILKKALEECEKAGYQLVNIDCTVIAEEPRIAPHVWDMKEKLGETLGIDASLIGIKATTNEKVGHIGQGLAIAAHAIALVCSAEQE